MTKCINNEHGICHGDRLHGEEYCSVCLWSLISTTDEEIESMWLDPMTDKDKVIERMFERGLVKRGIYPSAKINCHGCNSVILTKTFAYYEVTHYMPWDKPVIKIYCGNHCFDNHDR